MLKMCDCSPQARVLELLTQAQQGGAGSTREYPGRGPMGSSLFSHLTASVVLWVGGSFCLFTMCLMF